MMNSTFRLLTVLTVSLLPLARPVLAARHAPALAACAANPPQTVAHPAPRRPAAPAKAVPQVVVASAQPARLSVKLEDPTSPQTVVLKGIVLKADGQPCPGAGVYVPGAARQVVITNAAGEFTLPVPAGRPVAVQAEYFGLGSRRVNVANPTGQPLRIMLGN